ncbi:HAD family hydrolase [Paenisporosarcina quisquiliarum]|uniref:HAD family hydrolase n=1 Tax=Paenisporosarcina quisquiliarum TaxID=365346 RepID=UPI003736678B
MALTQIVIFDMDDTLYPESEYVSSGLKSISHFLYTKYNIPDFYNHAFALYKEGERGNIFNLALDQLGIHYNEAFIFQLVEMYRNHSPQIKLFEDADWALKYFRTYKGIGLLTDGYANSQISKVKALGIQDSFDFIVYTDLLGKNKWKPNHLPYLTMMEYFKGQAKDFVYVGDNPLKDFVAAKKLGWKTIKIRRTIGEYRDVKVDEIYDADICISSLRELSNVI